MQRINDESITIHRRSVTMKVKAVAHNNVVTVKILVQNITETGEGNNEPGNIVPDYYISELTIQHKGETVCRAELGPGISKDAWLNFRFTGINAGETISISRVDNQGRTEKREYPVAAQ